MCWEIILMNLQLSAFEERDNHLKIKSNLGGREEVIKKIVEILPMIQFDGATEGIVDEEDLYVEVKIDTEDPVPRISMIFDAGEEAGILRILRRIQEKSQWQAFDTVTNQFIDFKNDPLAGFRRLKKYMIEDQEEVERRRLIYHKYTKKSYLAIIPYLIIVGIFSFLWFKLFLFLADAVFQKMEKGIFLIFPEEYTWFLPALFISFVSAIPPFYWYYHWIYRKNREEFREYLKMTSPDGQTILKVVAILYLVIVVGYVGLSFHWYTRFTENEIVINKFWGLQEIRYPYDQVKLIYTVSEDDSPSKESYFTIVFDDGEQWISNQQGHELSKKISDEVVRLVLNKSGSKLSE